MQWDPLIMRAATIASIYQWSKFGPGRRMCICKELPDDYAPLRPSCVSWIALHDL